MFFGDGDGDACKEDGPAATGYASGAFTDALVGHESSGCFRGRGIGGGFVKGGVFS